MMKDKTTSLDIQTAENGFVVFDGTSARQGMVGSMWAFESAESLAKFIKNWGEDVHKPIESLPVLKKGKTLIITGDEGAGKTTTAIKIADQHGTHTLTSLQEITQGKFALSQVLEDEPDTVIIEDELNLIDSYLDFMKPLIANDKISIDRKDMVPKNVKAPNFIICTGDKEPLKHGVGERRFTVLPL